LSFFDNDWCSFLVSQAQLLELVSAETILVGHSLQSDLAALKVSHEYGCTKLPDLTAVERGVSLCLALPLFLL
jgi:hypothetical protein